MSNRSFFIFVQFQQQHVTINIYQILILLTLLNILYRLPTISTVMVQDKNPGIQVQMQLDYNYYIFDNYKQDGDMHDYVIIKKSRQKPADRNNNNKTKKLASQNSDIEEFLVFRGGNKQQQKQKPYNPPLQWTKSIDLKLQNTNKRPINNSNLRVEKQRDHQLPKEIVQFMQNSHKRSMLRERQRDQESLKERSSIGSFFIKSSYISDFTELSQGQTVSLLTELVQEQTSIIEIIANDQSKIYESKFERELLSTSEFKAKLQKIKLISEQPGKQFNFTCQLGKGSMCRVYKAENRHDSTKKYAVRIISIQHQKILQKLKEEIAVMNLCQSWNIIRYYFSYYYQNTLFMFIQYMDHGSLNHFIAHYGKSIPENIIAYIIRQILKGLFSIHKRRQVHRDLKSDNILINRNGDIKIADFGYAIQLTKDSQCSREIAGTPAWMAPELIKKEQYTESVDIWSLGIIVVQLCEGEPKYLKCNPFMAMLMIATKSPQTVTDRSVLLQSFLAKCLQKDPLFRATSKQLLSDPFINIIGNGVHEKGIFLNMLSQVPNRFF